ncbi:SusC/RagA family TonB-linked outer membrane protein [Rufibacter roseus]|uniref:SusC/RagA family TonB-linked outer membrane protein n=1 Tax=Rufibacter roseus TaxID=1567108 RepID=A0ABW2DLQ1_9BACT|nr:TonB-dependent receptor [Rufibacter roseus]
MTKLLQMARQQLRLCSLALLLVMLACWQNTVLAQAQTIKGKVTDNAGEALPGVSVVIKGTTSGTSTDINGEFQIPVSAGANTLVFSYIGYESQELSAQAGSEISVKLQNSASAIDEVLVVGYGTQKRTTMTGSVAQIGNKEITQAPPMNLSNVLAGRLPGLVAVQNSGRPGADNSALLVRGLSTTNGAAQGPLIIVDGVPRDNFQNLDPSEVETISILKDASAAVYGVQASNGVILITTKRGKVGKPAITYNTSFALNSNTRFPKFLNGPDYMQWIKRGEEMDNDYLMNTGGDPLPLTYTEDQIQALRNGTHTADFGNTDWVGDLVDNVSTSQYHNVSISGGTDKMRYFTSLGYFDQNGVVKNTNFTRYNFRTNLDVTFNDYLSSIITLGARREDRENPGVVADNSVWMSPFYQAVRALPNIPATYDGLPAAGWRSGGGVNPIAAVENSGFQRSETDVFQTNLSLVFKVPGVKGLEMKVQGAYDKILTESKNWLTPYYLSTRQITNTGFVWSRSLAPTATTTVLSQGYTQRSHTMFQPSINYSTTVGNDHTVSALLLYEFSQFENKNMTAGARNFPLTNIPELNFGGSATEDFVRPGGASSLTSRGGYVTRLNYGFQGKYLLEFSARYDESSNFPKHNRAGFFPGASVGWVVSNEPFFKDFSSSVNFLKLRGSYGKVGNDRASNSFAYLNTFALTTAPVVVIGGKPIAALYTGSPANLNLTWETTTISNVGLETSFWRGLLDVEVDFFYKVTRDILQGVSGIYPPSIGGFFPSTNNSAVVDNRGVDLQIRHRNSINKFSYGVTGNFNYAKNRILEYDQAANIAEWQNQIGRPMGGKYGFISEGLFQSWEEVNNWASSPSGQAAPGFVKYRDLNGDGQINASDQTYIGLSNVPEIMYGLNLDAQYGPFDFSALFQGAARRDVALGGTYEGAAGVSGVADNTPFTRSFYNLGNSPYYIVENSWTPENPGAYYPRLQANRSGAPNHNGHPNSHFVVDGSYLRLKSVQVGYSINKAFLNKLKVEQWRFYVAGSNIFTISDDRLKYLDPEMPNVSNGFYPQQRVVTVGTNITF